VASPRARVGVFAYDFPHRKTYDVLIRLFLEARDVKIVVGAPYRKLDIPEATVRTKVRHMPSMHPRTLSERLGFDYLDIAHEDANLPTIVKRMRLDVGVIAGARILKGPILDAFPNGIINLHPGAIPETRGLDAMLWAVRNDVPQAVTAHLIDRRVDAGKILTSTRIVLRPDDTPFDVQERLYEKQLDILGDAIVAAMGGNGRAVPVDCPPYNRKMSPELERSTLEMFGGYLRRHASE